MTHKIVQRHFLKGRREFAIVDDEIHVRIKTPFREETRSVLLTTLNPEPVLHKSFLAFTSRVNKEPLIALWPDKPNRAECDAFIERLKAEAQAAFIAFAGLRSNPAAAQAPDGPEQAAAPKPKKPLRPADIAASITLLSEQVKDPALAPFLNILKSLQNAPEDAALLSSLVTEFSRLGPLQGAVLAHAPYVIVLLSDDPCGF